MALSLSLQLSFAMLVTYQLFHFASALFEASENMEVFSRIYYSFAILIFTRVHVQRFVMESFDIHERYYYSTFM